MKPLLTDAEHAAFTASGCPSLTCSTAGGRLRLVVPLPSAPALADRLRAAGFVEQPARTAGGSVGAVLVLDRPALPTTPRAMQHTVGDA